MICPYKISINPKISEKAGLNWSVLKKAAEEFAMRLTEGRPDPRLFKKYNDKIDIGDISVWMTAEFQEDDIFHVSMAKRARG